MGTPGIARLGFSKHSVPTLQVVQSVERCPLRRVPDLVSYIGLYISRGCVWTHLNRRTRTTSQCHSEHPVIAWIEPQPLSVEAPGLSLAVPDLVTFASGLRRRHLGSATITCTHPSGLSQSKKTSKSVSHILM